MSNHWQEYLPIDQKRNIYIAVQNMTEDERQTRKIYYKSKIESLKCHNTTYISTLIFSILSMNISFMVAFANIGKEFNSAEAIAQGLYGLYTVFLVLAIIAVLYGTHSEHQRKQKIEYFCFYLSAIEEYECNRVETPKTTYKAKIKTIKKH